MDNSIILTEDDPVKKLLTQVNQIKDQTSEFKEHDDEVMNFNGETSDIPNMKLFNPKETFINYSVSRKNIIYFIIFIVFLLFIKYYIL